MSAPHQEIFDRIRDRVVEDLASAGEGNAREEGGADGGEAGFAAPSARAEGGARGAQSPSKQAQMAGVVAKIERFIETGDLGRFREFVRRWAVTRLGEGGSSESILHALMAIGDALVRRARERAAEHPELEVFARDVARASFWATRLVVEVLGEEREQREREHREIVEDGGG